MPADTAASSVKVLALHGLMATNDTVLQLLGGGWGIILHYSIARRDLWHTLQCCNDAVP
jgi:hypothetical protein